MLFRSSLVSSSGEGNQWYRNDEIIEGADRKYIIPTDTGSYTVQVTSKHGCESEMSEPFDITTGVNDLTTENIQFNIYPNPSGNQTKIEIYLPETHHTQIEIYNSIGQRIETFYSAYLTSGNHIFEKGWSGSRDGLYFVKVVSGGAVFVERVMVVR